MFLITSSPTHIADTDTRLDNMTALSGFLAWLGLWMTLVADGVLTDLEDRLYQKRFHYGLSASQIGLGYECGPSLLPEHARPPLNRAYWLIDVIDVFGAADCRLLVNIWDFIILMPAA